MLARFFIDRPIFGTVLSVVITLCGGIAMVSLPIALYPKVTPPSVSLSLSYPGANAQVVQDTIAAPIEQAVNGVQGMLYMSSSSGSDGSYSLSITFDVGTDINTALVMVQNRVALALPLLPSEVQAQGITVRKKSPDQLMIVSFYSNDPNYIDRDLSNFALINLKDEILRVPGVADVGIMGERDYAIRVWLDPRKLASRGMTAMDVATAVKNQSIQAAPGQTGQPPASLRQTSQLPIDVLARLSRPEQFGDIVVRVGPPPPSTSAASAGSAASGSDTSLPSSTSVAPIKGPTPASNQQHASSSSGFVVERFVERAAVPSNKHLVEQRRYQHRRSEQHRRRHHQRRGQQHRRGDRDSLPESDGERHIQRAVGGHRIRWRRRGQRGKQGTGCSQRADHERADV